MSTTVRRCITWVCVHCHRGWSAPEGPTPACSACGRLAQQRGGYLTVALTDPAAGADDVEGRAA